jgi:hypothetical protein
MPAPVVPATKAIYLCDDVVEDSNSGKLHLLGVFNSIRPASGENYPYVFDHLCVVAQFTDGLGDVELHFEVVEATTNTIAFTSPNQVLRFSRRQQTVYACLRLTQCPFPRPGVYVVELYCQGTFLDDRQLHLLTP